MSEDDAISPIAPVGTDPVARIDAEAIVARPNRAVSSTASLDSSALVGAPAVHEQLEHPVRSPAGIGRTASIHDAATHGNPIAEAIERAHVADPTDRAQQLGGAAASAASGQAAAIDRNRDAERSPDRDDDPLAPITRVQQGRHVAHERSSDEPA